jgi:hypothetical protein
MNTSRPEMFQLSGGALSLAFGGALREETGTA